MFTVPCTDLVDREIKEGDVIAYALTVGRSAEIAIYDVQSVVWVEHEYGSYPTGEQNEWGYREHKQGPHRVAKLKAIKRDSSYSSRRGPATKPVTLAMLERVLVINETAKAWA